MEKPINRENRDEVQQQIGYVKASIEFHNKKMSLFQKEIDFWPRRLYHLNECKKRQKGYISKKQTYLNQLEKDAEKLK